MFLRAGGCGSAQLLKDSPQAQPPDRPFLWICLHLFTRFGSLVQAVAASITATVVNKPLITLPRTMSANQAQIKLSVDGQPASAGNMGQ